jgi:flavorubredoxin
LSRFEGKEGAVIVCGAMYGNTVQLAEAVAQGLVQSGIKNVIIHDICKTEDSYIVSDIFKYRGLIVGSATYCNELHPDIYSLLNKVEIRQIKNREYAYFGSYTWSSAAVKKLAEFGEKMKWRTVDFSVEEKMGLKENNYHSCLRLGEKMAELLKKPNN